MVGKLQRAKVVLVVHSARRGRERSGGSAGDQTAARLKLTAVAFLAPRAREKGEERPRKSGGVLRVLLGCSNCAWARRRELAAAAIVTP